MEIGQLCVWQNTHSGCDGTPFIIVLLGREYINARYIEYDGRYYYIGKQIELNYVREI